MNISLGKVRGKDFAVDVDALRRSHLLLTGVSGSGKSYRLRCLAETLQPIMPVLVFDPEGEYYTLREKFPFLLFGDEGDAPLSVSTAGLLAQKVLEWKCSAIFDLSSLEPEQQHQWMANFLGGIMKAKREMWSPFAFLIDESHLFAPEVGQDPSIALRHVKNLCSRGRKRGFLVVLATQRITKLSNSCVSELQNVLIGRVTLTADRERAARQLGITRTQDKTSFFHDLKTLKDHYFYGQGLAVADELTLIAPLTAQTTHIRPGEIGVVPPAPPEMIKSFLPNLVAIEEEAKEQANTVEELRAQVVRLKAENMTLRQGRGLPAEAPAPVPVSIPVSVPDQKLKADLERMEALNLKFMKKIQDAMELLSSHDTGVAVPPKAEAFPRKADIVSPGVPTTRFVPPSSLIVHEPEPGVHSVTEAAEEAKPAPAPVVQFVQNTEPPPAAPEIELSMTERSILRVFANCAAVGIHALPRHWVSLMSGYVNYAGSAQSRYKRLIDRGLLDKPYHGGLALTPKSFAAVAPDPRDTIPGMMERGIRKACPKLDADILLTLLDAKTERVPREQVAAACEHNPTSSTFLKRLTELRKQGYIEYEVNSGLRLTIQWYTRTLNREMAG